MNYRVQGPRPALAPFVERFWYYDDLVSEHPRERVLPDGTFELLINLDDRPRRLFDRHDPSRHTAFRRSWLSGAHSQYLLIDVLPRSSMMGVHFKPGGAAPVLGLPAGEFADAVVELEAIWGRTAGELCDALLEQTTPETKMQWLEAHLTRLAARRPGRSAAIADACRRFTARPHELTIRDVTRQCGFSPKHFVELFRREVGMTPKRFCRVRRFQQVLRDIERRQRIDWADLAVACGYYDQPHFIHEFQAFSGLNPTSYLSQRGEYLNYVPERD